MPSTSVQPPVKLTAKEALPEETSAEAEATGGWLGGSETTMGLSVVSEMLPFTLHAGV